MTAAPAVSPEVSYQMSRAVADPRERILRAAAKILAAHGREAVSTRAVSAAADVQPPTIYRHFDDMGHLVAAAASRGMADYLVRKRNWPPTADPVDEVRCHWDLHVEFGLRNPNVYTVLYGDPRSDAVPAGVAEAQDALVDAVRRVGEDGRLRVGVTRAAALLHAGCRGVTLTLLGTPPADRDPGLPEELRESILTTVLTETGMPEAYAPPASGVRALKSMLLPRATSELSAAEVGLLSEWLDRLVGAVAEGPQAVEAPQAS